MWSGGVETNALERATGLAMGKSSIKSAIVSTGSDTLITVAHGVPEPGRGPGSICASLVVDTLEEKPMDGMFVARCVSKGTLRLFGLFTLRMGNISIMYHMRGGSRTRQMSSGPVGSS